MADLNSVNLTGRLTRQAEIKYSQGGGAVVRFSLAVNRRKRTADGNGWEDEANFFDCVYFGRSAESVNQYLEKGRQVAITGELRQDRWQTDDGQNRSKVEIYVNQLHLIGSRSDGAQQGGWGDGQASARPSSQGGWGQQGGGYYGQNQQQPQGGWQGSRNGGGQNGPVADRGGANSRFSGAFSRAPQGAPDSASDGFPAGGPENYGDDDVPF